MRRTIFLVFEIVCHLFYVYCNVKYEVLLDNATECTHPEPPFAKKRTFFSSYTMRQHKKTTYLSGEYRVLVDMPFYNLSIKTFAIDDGKPQLKVHINKQNCRSWTAKIFLVTSDFHYNKKDCRVQKGIYVFKDFDINKATHAMPAWHAAGTTLTRVQMIQNGVSVFCIEIVSTIRDIE